MTRSESVAVIDLGSARTKLLIATRHTHEHIEFTRDKRETGLAASTVIGGIIPEEAIGAVDQILRKYLSDAMRAGCHRIVTVATEVFRSIRNSDEAFQRFSSVVGPVNVISAYTEGLLYFDGLDSTYSFDEPFCATDIGGGSVQVVWSNGAPQVVSLPTGTYRLEREFQSSGSPTAQEWANISHAVQAAVSKEIPKELRRPILVVGSNNMYDFLGSALRVGGGEQLTSFKGVPATSLVRIRTLLSEVRRHSYEELASYFPENPFFMRGADKALINLIGIGSAIEASVVVPTNESISTSIARLLLISPNRLSQLGVKWHEVQ